MTTKQTFTDDRAALQDVIRQLREAADDQLNGGGIRVDTGGAFGEDDDTFNIFSTDRQLAALQTAVTDLGPLPEVKTLVYFGSGLRLNGADNQAQLRATVNAAVRSNVTINPIDTRGLMAEPLLGDATQASPGGVGMFNGAVSRASGESPDSSSRKTPYYALAKDTGGHAMFDDVTILSAGIVQAAQAVTRALLHDRLLRRRTTRKDGRFRRVKVAVRIELCRRDLSYRPGYYAGQGTARSSMATEKGERALEERSCAPEDPDHRDSDGAGRELLPAQRRGSTSSPSYRRGCRAGELARLRARRQRARRRST